ncbi:hypothetical protein DID75_05455 [Candidatus Marinamargulisbacteria bacterium SCGC AG-410-N11]|nr:hypothetical protein DID75_05455 [Candidatus Marinamargulisbacteria bacterium SCGC AG-410-N11]
MNHSNNKPLRILLTAVTFLPDIGGSELGMARVIKGLAEYPNVSIVILSPNNHVKKLKEQFPECTVYGTPHHLKEPFILGYELTFAFKLLWLCIRYRIQIIHCHWSGFPANLIRVIGSLLRIPYFITVCGGDVNEVSQIEYGLTLSSVYKKIVIQNLKKAAHVIAKSPSLKHRVQQLVPAQKSVSIIPNIIFFQQKITQKVSAKPPIIVTIARNHPVKHYELALMAIAELKKIRTDFKYIIIGKDTDQLMPLAKSLNIEQNINILGQQSESVIHDMLSQSTVFFLTSYIEGCPQVCFQALSYNLPLVLTQNPGLKDLVTPIGSCEGKVGNSSTELASALNDYLNHRKKINNYDVVDSITTADIIKAHLTLYYDCCDQKKITPMTLWYKIKEQLCAE